MRCSVVYSGWLVLVVVAGLVSCGRGVFVLLPPSGASAERCFLIGPTGGPVARVQYESPDQGDGFVRIRVYDDEQHVVLDQKSKDAGVFTFAPGSRPKQARICFTAISERASSTAWRFFFHVDRNAVQGQTSQSTQQELLLLQSHVRALERKVKAVRSEQAYQKSREEAFRVTSESTSSRVLWWAVSQTCILLLCGLWQVQHLRRFFNEKKLV